MTPVIVDPVELVADWRSAIADFKSAIAPALEDEELWHKPTRLPGWTVADVAAHVVGIEAELAGRGRPPHNPDWAALPHVGDDPFARYTEVDVDLRRGMPARDVAAELASVAAQRSAQLQAQLDERVDPHAPATGPGGWALTWAKIVGMRTFDVWVHALDVWDALGAEVPAPSIAAHYSIGHMVKAMPRVWSTVASPGQVLRIEVSGDIEFDIRMRVNEQGRGEWVELDEDALEDVALVTDWMSFVCLACGRASPQPNFEVRGDAIDADRLVGALNIAP